VREEAIAEEHAEGIPPFGIGGGCLAADLGSVDDVVVNEGGDMNELENDRELVVIVRDLAGRTARKKGEGRTDPFAGGVENVGDVGLDRRIKGVGLLADAGLDPVQFGPEEGEGRKLAAVRRVEGRGNLGHDTIRN
jgi:hypothetical protein